MSWPKQPPDIMSSCKYVVCPKSKCTIFLCMNWQRSTSFMYIGTLVVTLAACPYLFQLDWLSQSCATTVCVWLRCMGKVERVRCVSMHSWRPTVPCVSHFDVCTMHLVQFIVQTNKCTTYVWLLLCLRCRKISNKGMLPNFVCNSTNLPPGHLLL